MIRILYVHHGKGIGGAPLSLLYTIGGLDRMRFYPTVLCLYESEAVDLFRNAGIETLVAHGIDDFSHTNVSWYNLLQFPKALYRLLKIPFSIDRASRFLAAHQFDIVHLNTSTLFAFAIAAKRAGLKVVSHIREPLHHGYFGIRRSMIQNAIHAHADIIIPICYYDAGQLIPSDKIHVVYNFIDFKKFDSSLHAEHPYHELNIPEVTAATKIITMLGGVNPIKGTFEFVEAAARVIQQHADAHFLVVGAVPVSSLRNRMNGSTSYYHGVLKSIRSHHLEDRVHFTGNRNDVPEILSITNVLCFPSTVPHFARPIIEASAMGIPVVASDLGGPHELVRQGETGLLVAPRDIGALADAIQSLLEDPIRAKRMGEQGIALAREKFSSEKNVQEIIFLYEALLQG